MVIRDFIRRTWSSTHFQTSKQSSRSISDSGKVKISNKMDKKIDEDDQTDVILEYITKPEPENSSDTVYHSTIDTEIEKKILHFGKVNLNQGTNDQILNYAGQTSTQDNGNRSSGDGNKSNPSYGTSGKLFDFPGQAVFKLETKRKVLDYGECTSANREPDEKIVDISLRNYGEAMLMKCEQAGKKLKDGVAAKKLTELGDELKKKIPDWQKKMTSSLSNLQEFVMKKWLKKED